LESAFHQTFLTTLLHSHFSLGSHRYPSLAFYPLLYHSVIMNRNVLGRGSPMAFFKPFPGLLATKKALDPENSTGVRGSPPPFLITFTPPSSFLLLFANWQVEEVDGGSSRWYSEGGWRWHLSSLCSNQESFPPLVGHLSFLSPHSGNQDEQRNQGGDWSGWLR